MDIKQELFKLGNKEYQVFQSRLIPTRGDQALIGVRMPQLRKLTKEIVKAGAHLEFLKTLPHEFYEENVLHSLIINEIKDVDLVLELLREFRPYLNNWAVVDAIKPLAVKKDLQQTKEFIHECLKSEHEYTVRLGVLMLLNFFVKEDFALEWVNSIKHEGYYVQMIQAWFFCEAFIQNRDLTLKLIKSNQMNRWVHNKTISKCSESFRVSESDKLMLKSHRQ